MTKGCVLSIYPDVKEEPEIIHFSVEARLEGSLFSEQ